MHKQNHKGADMLNCHKNY